MKHLILSLVVAAGFVSDADAGKATKAELKKFKNVKKDCSWSHKENDCFDPVKFAQALVICKKSTVEKCLKTGCNNLPPYSEGFRMSDGSYGSLAAILTAPDTRKQIRRKCPKYSRIMIYLNAYEQELENKKTQEQQHRKP